MKTFIGITYFLFSNILVFGQISEDFSDGNFTLNPIWNGNNSTFIVNSSYQLQSYNTIASTSFLTTDHTITTLENKEWRFWVKLSFSPSSNNNAKVYLTSTNSDLSIQPDGFFIQLGETGSTDAVRLMKSENGIETEICSGTLGAIATSFAISVRVVRDNIGNWQLFTDNTGGDNFVNPAVGFDDANLLGTSFGFYCKYTVSNATKFYFDNVYVGDIIQDTTPPEIESIQVVYNQQIDIIFNEPIDVFSAQNTSNYSLSPTVSISGIQVDNSNPKLIHLGLATPLINGNTYQLQINGVSDLDGNPSNTNESFIYRIAEVPSKGDVIITEIMSDPIPSVGLPEVEFIEIYNRSNKYFNLENWKIEDETSIGTIASSWLSPGEYTLICSTTMLDEYPNGVGCSNFPNLNNNGDHLKLKYSNGTLLDELSYAIDFFQEEDKKSGGYSLERKNLNLPCFKSTNWDASTNTIGGTPGLQNSIIETLGDDINPTLKKVSVNAVNQIVLVFDEEMDSVSLMNATLNFSPHLNVTNRSAESEFVDFFTLTFTEELNAKIDYEVQLIHVSDCSNNTTDIIGSFVLPELAELGDVVINELMFNPLEGGQDYIECFNLSDKNIDLYGWNLSRVKDNQLDDVKTIQEHFILKSKEYVVLSGDTSFITENYPNSKGGNFIEMSLPAMNIDSNTIVLSSPDFRIDQVAYHSDWHLKLLKDEKGKALERIDPYGASNSSFNWRTAAESELFGTPTYKNSQAISTVESNQNFSIVFETITPNNDGLSDYLELNYKLEEGGFLATFSIFDQSGNVVKTIFQNELLGTEGTMIWDCFNLNDQIVSSGIYLAVIEAFSENGGEPITFKKAFVVYSN